MTLKAFSELYNNSRHQNIPEHARPIKIFRENSANELTKSIIAYLEFKNIQCFRQSSEGRMLPAKQIKNVIGQTITVGSNKWIPRSKGGVGKSDISATLPPHGKRLEIEVKYGKDKQSDVQKEFQKQTESMGGIYLLVKNWDSFIYLITPLIK